MQVRARDVEPQDIIYFDGRTERVETVKMGAGRITIRSVDEDDAMIPHYHRLREDDPVTVSSRPGAERAWRDPGRATPFA